jgi:hypothetical protein
MPIVNSRSRCKLTATCSPPGWTVSAWLDGFVDGDDDILSSDLGPAFMQEVLLGECSPGASSTAVQDCQAGAASQHQSSSSNGAQQQGDHPLLEPLARQETVDDIFEAFDAFLQGELEQNGSCQPDAQQQQQQLHPNAQACAHTMQAEMHRHGSLDSNNCSSINSGSRCHTPADAALGMAVAEPLSPAAVQLDGSTAAAAVQPALRGVVIPVASSRMAARSAAAAWHSSRGCCRCCGSCSYPACHTASS